MPTIQQQLNQLKKDKASLNTMLNTMGVETTGNETFTELTPLVGKIVANPILQDKSIEITENGTTTITADEGYDGLNNVSVTTNVAGSGGGGKYTPRHLSMLRFSNYTGTELDYEVENLDTSNLTSMASTFFNCSKLEKLDLSNWNTTNVTSTKQMFYNCQSLTTLILGENFVADNITDTSNMFQNCSELKTLVIKSKTPFPISGSAMTNCNLASDYYARIYLPDELVETYKTMDYWKIYDLASKMRPLSEYTG